MAYNKNKILEQAIKQIEKHSLYFIEDVVAYIPCDKTTFYRLFPKDSNEYNSIKDSLEKNRINTKVSMRKKWNDSDNATLQMGLMKLIGTEDEAHRLNGSSKKVEHSGNQTVVWKEEKTYEADKETD